MPIRTNVYVDGFNLYYGGVKGTPFKWLNIVEMSRQLLKPDHVIGKVRYFTARATPRPNNPTITERQNTYLRALATLPEISIHFGMFLTNPATLPLADGTGMATVLRTEEKGSDVNLATYLLLDAFDDDYETALVISNDSDLVEPILQARRRLGVTVGICCPVYTRGRHPSRQLVEATDFNVHLAANRKRVLRDCQFPVHMEDGQGRFRKPDRW